MLKPQKLRLRQYFKAAALLDDTRIFAILNEQKQTNLLFGELAIRKGWIEVKTVNFFLEVLA